MEKLYCKNCKRKDRCRENKDSYRNNVNFAIDNLVRLALGNGDYPTAAQKLRELIATPTECDIEIESLQSQLKEATEALNELQNNIDIVRDAFPVILFEHWSDHKRFDDAMLDLTVDAEGILNKLKEQK